MVQLPETLCYLNGDYTPLHQAKVSVLDRGFIFGDGIYDVVPVYGRKLFRFAQHLARLERNLCRPIGSGAPGPVFQRLYSAYQGAKAAQATP